MTSELVLVVVKFTGSLIAIAILTLLLGCYTPLFLEWLIKKFRKPKLKESVVRDPTFIGETNQDMNERKIKELYRDTNLKEVEELLKQSLLPTPNEVRKMTFSQHPQNVENKPMVVVTSTREPSDEEKLRHQRMLEIYNLCLKTGVRPPDEILSKVIGPLGHLIADVSTEQVGIPFNLEIELAGEKKTCVTIPACHLENCGDLRIVFYPPKLDKAPEQPKGQPHDGARRIDTKKPCGCQRCCQFRKFHMLGETPTEEDYK